MNVRYCVDCDQLERRPCMAETELDSGTYVQNGWYYRCKECGKVFNQSEEEIEFQHCVCGH